MKKLMIVFALAMTASTMAMEPGRYQNESREKLLLLEDGTILVTQLRQVGGPGGVSKEGLVPYPTVCEFVQAGKIVREDKLSIVYQVKNVQLVRPGAEKDSENCIAWVALMNAYALTHDLNYSFFKSEFKKIESF